MDNRRRILWVTRTAVFVALLVVLQAATAALGNTFVTGSIVNLILIIAAIFGGIASGATVAIISPVMARLFGIGPQLWSLLPFIMFGNVVIVAVWHIVLSRLRLPEPARYITAAICGAVMKFLALYFGIVKIAVPFLLELSEKQAATISAMFSIPQLLTALIGGAVACLILPILKRAVKKAA